MKLKIITAVSLLLPALNFAQEATEKGIDQRIEEMFKPISDFWTGLVFLKYILPDMVFPLY